jgi:YbaB/EbfC DNA-binding family protein
MFGEDLDAADRWVDSWQSSVEKRAAQARALSQRVAGLSATARDDARLIEVTVDSTGMLSDLRLDERVRRLPAGDLAGRILAVMAAAQATLTGQVAQAATELLGADSASGRAVIDSYTRRFGVSPARPADAGR